MSYLLLLIVSGALALNVAIATLDLTVWHRPDMAAISVAAAAFLLPIAIYQAVKAANMIKQ